MKALLIIDLQPDFVSGGTLPVPYGITILPLITAISAKENVYCVATQDWHPINHCSFVENGGIWPRHCVQGTVGASLPWNNEELGGVDFIVKKGQDPNVDSYSAFWDNDRVTNTGLAEHLREKGISEVYLCGLALDFCVKYSALDAVKEGFKTYVITDACKGVNIDNSIEKSLKEMEDAGVILIRSDQL